MYYLVPEQIVIKDIDNLESTSVTLREAGSNCLGQISIDEYIEILKEEKALSKFEDDLKVTKRKGLETAISIQDLKDCLESLESTDGEDKYKVILRCIIKAVCVQPFVTIRVGNKKVGVGIDRYSKKLIVQIESTEIKYLNMIVKIFGAVGLIKLGVDENDKIMIPRIDIKSGELKEYQNEIEIRVDGKEGSTYSYPNGIELNINKLLETEGIESVSIKAQYIDKVIANTDIVKGKRVVFSASTSMFKLPFKDEHLGTLDISHRKMSMATFISLMERTQKEKLIMNNCEIDKLSDLFSLLNFTRFRYIEAYNLHIVNKEYDRWEHSKAQLRRFNSIDMLTDRGVVEDLQCMMETDGIVIMSLEEYSRMIGRGKKLSCDRPESVMTCIVYR